MEKLFVRAAVGALFLAMPLTAVAQYQGQYWGPTQYQGQFQGPTGTASQQTRRTAQGSHAYNMNRNVRSRRTGCTHAKEMSGAPCL